MEDTRSDSSQPVANPNQAGRTWEDVAREIINESNSEKLSYLVKELCEILDQVPKSSARVGRQDSPTKISKR